jgi:hypothetical protein
MNSSYIKTVLMCWLRFNKQIAIVATEAGKYNSDVIYSTNNQLFEIEVKTSLADFKEDFKKPKHLEYKVTTNQWAPNFFLFAVPLELVDKVLPLLENSSYGLLAISQPFNESNILVPWEKRVKVLKRPKVIHTRRCNGLVKQMIVKRLASELCGLRQKIYSKDK